MSRLKIAYLIDAAIALLLVILIPCLLDNKFEPAGSLAYYLVAKIILALILVCALVYGFFGKAANGTNTTLIAVATIYQFIPLAIRYIVISGMKHFDILVIVSVAVLTMVFVGLAFGLSYQDAKMIAREEKAAPNEIPVAEEKVTLSRKDKE